MHKAERLPDCSQLGNAEKVARGVIASGLDVATPAQKCYMKHMEKSGTGAQRVRRRHKLRAAGLRPMQIWVPDTRAPGFAAECLRQMQNVRDTETLQSRAEDEAWFALSTDAWDDRDK